MRRVTISFVLLTVALVTAKTVVHAQQSDWVEYKDELYIKAFSNWDTYEGAKEFCWSQGDELSRASLVMVKESDLQQLLTNYTQDIADNIWLGGKYDDNSSQFKWEDGDLLTYTNWHDGYPRNVTDGDACIELIPLDVKQSTKSQGKWTHVTCRKRNQVMCQKRIPWTLEDAVREIKKNRKDLEEEKGKREQVESKLEEAATKLQQVETNLEDVGSRVVPVGSIYVEYFNQPSPQSLWPHLGWQDITDTYAGLFFRAYGGGSEAEWGATQAECSPRITSMRHHQQEGVVFPNPIGIPPSGWSEFGHAGNAWSMTYFEGLSFHTEGCEVRPRNQAIKIWKRVA